MTLTDEEAEILMQMAKRYGYRPHKLAKFMISKAIIKEMGIAEQLPYKKAVKSELGFEKSNRMIRNYIKVHPLTDLWD